MDAPAAVSNGHDTTGSRTTLEHLAHELLLEILQHFSLSLTTGIDSRSWEGSVEINARIRSLHSLSLTSRKLHRVANPLLYRTLTRGAVASSRRHFLRTVVQNPELGALVREVRFHYFDYEPSAAGIPPELPAVLDAAKSVDFGDDAVKAKFLRDIGESFNDADVALLFSQLPNLAMLEFEVDETWWHSWQYTLRLVQRAAETRAGPFSSLDHLRARYGNEQNSGFHPMFITDFVRLSSLKSVDVIGAWTGERTGTRTWSSAPSRLESITFRSSDVDISFVREMMASFQNMRSFSYSWGNVPSFTSTEDVAGLVEALELRKDTLEHISIFSTGRKDAYERAVDDGRDYPPVGSFKKFTRLKRLDISQMIFTDLAQYFETASVFPVSKYPNGAEMFPPSLEVLRLDCEDITETGTNGTGFLRSRQMFIKTLLQASSEQLPNLRRLDLLVRTASVPGRMREMEALASASGVVVEVSPSGADGGRLWWAGELGERYGCF